MPPGNMPVECGSPVRHPKLLLVFHTQIYTDPLTKCSRALAQVNCHIEYFALRDSHEFALGLLDLIVQSTQDIFRGF